MTEKTSIDVTAIELHERVSRMLRDVDEPGHRLVAMAAGAELASDMFSNLGKESVAKFYFEVSDKYQAAFDAYAKGLIVNKKAT